MKVYTVEKVIDMGNHVVKIANSRDLAEEILFELEMLRIQKLERNCRELGIEPAAWQYKTQHEIYEHTLEE